jgi:hypothetical protein
VFKTLNQTVLNNPTEYIPGKCDLKSRHSKRNKEERLKRGQREREEYKNV